MKRVVLPLVSLGLFAMVVVERLSQALASDTRSPAAQDASDSGSSAVVLRRGEPPESVAPTRLENRALRAPAAPGSRTPTIDRLARLATRQALSRESGLTYLDSLMVSTDSILRRWPDGIQTPLRVALVEGEPHGYRPKMAELMREALARWESAGIGVRFTIVSDTANADILVRWIDQFDFDRAGQTDLTWDQAGRVRKAIILLAIRTNTGVVLPDPALLVVAVHETGHALGLPHSPDTNDVMFPATQTGVLSDRDRRTVQLLYRLPHGPLRDVGGSP